MHVTVPAYERKKPKETSGRFRKKSWARTLLGWGVNLDPGFREALGLQKGTGYISILHHVFKVMVDFSVACAWNLDYAAHGAWTMQRMERGGGDPLRTGFPNFPYFQVSAGNLRCTPRSYVRA